MGGRWEEKCQGFQTELTESIANISFKDRTSNDQLFIYLSFERTSLFQLSDSMDQICEELRKVLV